MELDPPQLAPTIQRYIPRFHEIVTITEAGQKSNGSEQSSQKLELAARIDYFIILTSPLFRLGTQRIHKKSPSNSVNMQNIHCMPSKFRTDNNMHRYILEAYTGTSSSNKKSKHTEYLIFCYIICIVHHTDPYMNIFCGYKYICGHRVSIYHPHNLAFCHECTQLYIYIGTEKQRKFRLCIYYDALMMMFCSAPAGIADCIQVNLDLR